MAKTGNLLAALLALFCLANFVYAQDYSLHSGKFHSLKEREENIEFEFYNAAYDICENEKKAIPIMVVNKGADEGKYSLSAFGASWAELTAKEFSLPKKQSGVVFLNLNPRENSNGRYHVNVNALSSIGNARKGLNLEINVEKCYALDLELEKREDKICAGVAKAYLGEITNYGKGKNNVSLTVKGPNWLNADKSFFAIDSYNKQKFELNADVPLNARGIFNALVTASAKNAPSIKSEKNLRMEVLPKYDCYKADVITAAKITNDYSNAYIPIKIWNTGIRQASYEASLEAPEWITMEPKRLAINPEQFGNLNLNINPAHNVSQGNYPIKIHIKFEDISYSKNIEVVLSKRQFLEKIKLFFIFYQYYIYTALAAIIILFFSGRIIANKIKTAYKGYKTKRARLKALEAARKARMKKHAKKEIKIREIKIEEPPKPEIK